MKSLYFYGIIKSFLSIFFFQKIYLSPSGFKEARLWCCMWHMEPWCSTLYHAYWVRVILVCFAVEWQTNINKKNNKCGPSVEDVSIKAMINLNFGFSGGRICFFFSRIQVCRNWCEKFLASHVLFILGLISAFWWFRIGCCMWKLAN